MSAHGPRRLAGHRLTTPVTVGLDVDPGPAFMSNPERHCAPGKLQHHPDIFFSVLAKDRALARAICADCPVAVSCLTYAIDNGEQFGVWSGVDMEYRRRNRTAPAVSVAERKAQAQAARAAAVTAEKERIDAKVRELWGQGLPDVTIALCAGLHPGAVTRIRKRLGLAAL